jgi:hypothetical protein
MDAMVQPWHDGNCSKLPVSGNALLAGSRQAPAMDILPSEWRVHHGRDPEKQLRNLHGRFRAISRRLDRTAASRRVGRAARRAAIGVALLVIAIGVSSALVMELSPWPVMTTIRHLAAGPNCDAARLVSVAPAVRGQPGYWLRHDADSDGIACELWPRP